MLNLARFQKDAAKLHVLKNTVSNPMLEANVVITVETIVNNKLSQQRFVLAKNDASKSKADLAETLGKQVIALIERFLN